MKKTHGWALIKARDNTVHVHVVPQQHNTTNFVIQTNALALKDV